MRFFKNASKTQYNGRKKVILRRRAQKNVSPFTPAKKWRRSPKKINLSISNAPEINYVSHLCFNSKHADATLSVTKCAQLKEITLTTPCFIFVLFLFVPLLQQVF